MALAAQRSARSARTWSFAFTFVPVSRLLLTRATSPALAALWIGGIAAKRAPHARARPADRATLRRGQARPASDAATARRRTRR
jgi:hypothetical protein